MELDGLLLPEFVRSEVQAGLEADLVLSPACKQALEADYLI